MTRPKNWRIWSNISGSTRPIFAIFTPYKIVLRADDGSVGYFLICKGTLPWQPNYFAKMLSTWTDTTCIRCTSARKRIAISWSRCMLQQQNDASKSCEYFVKFGPVTPELAELICERHVRLCKKKLRISSNISRYT